MARVNRKSYWLFVLLVHFLLGGWGLLAQEESVNCAIAPYTVEGQARAVWAEPIDGNNSSARRPVNQLISYKQDAFQDQPPTENIAFPDWINLSGVQNYISFGESPINIVVVDDFETTNLKGVTHGQLVEELLNQLISVSGYGFNLVRAPITFGSNTDAIKLAIEDAISQWPEESFVLNMSIGLIPCDSTISPLFVNEGQLSQAVDYEETLGLVGFSAAAFAEETLELQSSLVEYASDRLAIPHLQISSLFEGLEPGNYLNEDLYGMLSEEGWLDQYNEAVSAYADIDQGSWGDTDIFVRETYPELLTILGTYATNRLVLHQQLEDDPLKEYLAENQEKLWAVAAAGNLRNAAPLAPARWTEVLAVSGYLFDDPAVTSWSNLAGETAVSNQGEVMVPGAWYELLGHYWGGTSMATPVMSVLTAADLTDPNDGSCILQQFRASETRGYGYYYLLDVLSTC